MYSKKEKIELLERLWEDKAIYNISDVVDVATRPCGLICYKYDASGLCSIVDSCGDIVEQPDTSVCCDASDDFNYSFVPWESLTDDELYVLNEIEDETNVKIYEMLDSQYHLGSEWLDDWYIDSRKYDLDLEDIDDELLDQLVDCDYDWYYVVYGDGDKCFKHATELSNILQCGHSPGRYDIETLQRGFNGWDPRND